MTRNPLYFFSTVAAVGMGLVFGSIIVAGILGLVAYLVFRSTGKREADHLLRIFGPTYRAYADATPAFWPNPRLYIDKPKWLFSPPALRSTFLDGLWFLAIFPGLELLEFMHADRTLPVLLRLY